MASEAHIIGANPEAFKRAAACLKQGGLVGLPTETVYGLAAYALNDEAVQRVYKVKNRPTYNPLIAHILRPEDVHKLAHVSPLAQTLIKAFWPGPLTLVLPRKPECNVSQYAGAGLETIAVRCPDVPWAQAFIEAGFNGPLVMPSANLSGRISPTLAAHVAADFGANVDIIIDGGPCAGGVESTVISVNGKEATLLRPGPIPFIEFAPYISDLRLPVKEAKPIAPGMLKSHYAPRAAVRLNAMERQEGEAYLAFGTCSFDTDGQLSITGDLAEAARNLYANLRDLDRNDIHTIAIAPIPEEGIGAAINDRLRRAAADRSE
ncbi:MAG: L-threonylcarbamoyladenylate synthase [Maricaulaceae bacterium]